MIGTKTPPLSYGDAPQVSLLPHAERERRERGDLARRWGTIALAVVVVMVILSGGMALYERSAHASLAQERDRTTALAQELATYHDVSTATRILSTYQAYRTQAMSADVSWAGLFRKLRAKMPAGATITGFDAVTSPTVTPSGQPSTASTAATAPQGTAVTVTLTLSSRRSLDQKAMLLGFERIPGVLRVDLNSLSSGDSAAGSATAAGADDYTGTSVVYFDDSVYSGRYAHEGATP